jgi:hypothetical protein
VCGDGVGSGFAAFGLRKVGKGCETYLEIDATQAAIVRQWVITQARKKSISEADMDLQLAALDLQELHLKKELATSQKIVNLAELENWEQYAREYLEDVRVGIEIIKAEPQSEEERHGFFEVKRGIVQQIVERGEIDKDRNLTVLIRLDILALIRQQTVPIDKAGICSRTRSSLDRHCFAARASPSRPACRS